MYSFNFTILKALTYRYMLWLQFRLVILSHSLYHHILARLKRFNNVAKLKRFSNVARLKRLSNVARRRTNLPRQNIFIKTEELSKT